MATPLPTTCTPAACVPSAFAPAATSVCATAAAAAASEASAEWRRLASARCGGTAPRRRSFGPRRCRRHVGADPRVAAPVLPLPRGGAVAPPAACSALASLSLLLLLLLPPRGDAAATSPAITGQGDSACTFVSVALRCGSWPIDLEPAFRPHILKYSVVLDFAMSSFYVDIRPASGCEADQELSAALEVPIGGRRTLKVASLSTETGEGKQYELEVMRLLGSETELQVLTIEGSVLTPSFSPSVRTYIALLDLSFDEVHIIYRLRDNEQRIRSSALEERPTTLKELQHDLPQTSVNASDAANDVAAAVAAAFGSTAGDAGGNKAPAPVPRLLRSPSTLRSISGEAQFQDAYESFMVDSGFTRVVELTVQCADPTQANIGTYRLVVLRPRCPADRPSYSAIKRACVHFCPTGYYHNHNLYRCSTCNSNCRVCSGFLTCTLCNTDTDDYTYVLQSDGSCRAIENHLFEQYRWWCAALSVLFLILVTIGCAGWLQVLLHGVGIFLGQNSRRVVHAIDSDSDSPRDEPAPRRRLGAY
eukprot:NODE_4611_length_1869_cov_8.020666.p1 GENE.NODE_4611_length_1869_cov_8.020666~~NODE_4611_length_1869_cov_8.020666.p1  ORF type:complete len:534 (+),score=137.84 NODE_4611_length_1869_cov_8.020666:79-1680(+)